MSSQVSVSDHCPEEVKSQELEKFSDPAIECRGVETDVEGEKESKDEAVAENLSETEVKEQPSSLQNIEDKVEIVDELPARELESIGEISELEHVKKQEETKVETVKETLDEPDKIVNVAEQDNREISDVEPAKKLEETKVDKVEETLDEPEKVVDIAKQDREISDVEPAKKLNEPKDEIVKEIVDEPERIIAVAEQSLKDTAFEKLVGETVHFGEKKVESVDETPNKEVEVKDDVPEEPTLHKVEKEERVEELIAEEDIEAADNESNLSETKPLELIEELSAQPTMVDEPKQSYVEEESPSKGEEEIKDKEVNVGDVMDTKTAELVAEPKVSLVDEKTNDPNEGIEVSDKYLDKVEEEALVDTNVTASEVENKPECLSKTEPVEKLAEPIPEQWSREVELIEEQPEEPTKRDYIPEQSDAVPEKQDDEILPAEKLEESKVEKLETRPEEENQVLEAKDVPEIDEVKDKTEFQTVEEEINLPPQSSAEDTEKKIGIVEELPAKAERETTEIKPIVEKPVEQAELVDVEEESSVGSFVSKLEKEEALIAKDTESTELKEEKHSEPESSKLETISESASLVLVHTPDGVSEVTEKSEEELPVDEKDATVGVEEPVDKIDHTNLMKTEEPIAPEAQVDEISEKKDLVEVDESAKKTELIDTPLEDKVSEPENIGVETEGGEKIEDEQSEQKPTEDATSETQVDEKTKEIDVPLGDQISEPDKTGVETEDREKNEEKQPKSTEDVTVSVPTSQTQVEENILGSVAEGEESAKNIEEVDVPLKDKIPEQEKIGVETENQCGPKPTEDAASSISTSETIVDVISEKTDVPKEESPKLTVEVDAPLEDKSPEPEKIGVDAEDLGEKVKEAQCEPKLEGAASSIPTSETQAEEKISEKTNVAEDGDYGQQTVEIDAPLEDKIPDKEKIGVETEDQGEKTVEEPYEPKTTESASSSIPTPETKVDEKSKEINVAREDTSSRATEEQCEPKLENAANSISTSETQVEEKISDKTEVAEEESAKQTVEVDASLEDKIPEPEIIVVETDDQGGKTEEDRCEPKTTEVATSSIPTPETQVDEISKENDVVREQEFPAKNSEIDAPVENKISEPEKIAIQTEDRGIKTEERCETKPTEDTASSFPTFESQVDEISEKNDVAKEEQSAKKTLGIDPPLEYKITEPLKIVAESEDRGEKTEEKVCNSRATEDTASPIPMPEITERSPVAEVTYKDIEQVGENCGTEDEIAKERAVEGNENELLNREAEKTEPTQKTEDIGRSLKEKLEREKKDDETSKTDVKNTESTVEREEEEVPVKSAHKQSNNIMKMVKHSLVKAKKAIIGKSTHSKASETKGDEVCK